MALTMPSEADASQVQVLARAAGRWLNASLSPRPRGSQAPASARQLRRDRKVAFDDNTKTIFESRCVRHLGFIREEGEKNDSSKGTSAHPDSPDYISRRCRFVSAKQHTSMVTTVDGLVFGFGNLFLEYFVLF